MDRRTNFRLPSAYLDRLTALCAQVALAHKVQEEPSKLQSAIAAALIAAAIENKIEPVDDDDRFGPNDDRHPCKLPEAVATKIDTFAYNQLRPSFERTVSRYLVAALMVPSLTRTPTFENALYDTYTIVHRRIIQPSQDIDVQEGQSREGCKPGTASGVDSSIRNNINAAAAVVPSPRPSTATQLRTSVALLATGLALAIGFALGVTVRPAPPPAPTVPQEPVIPAPEPPTIIFHRAVENGVAYCATTLPAGSRIQIDDDPLVLSSPLELFCAPPSQQP